MTSPLDPPAQLSALPSPPTSPTSPRAATTRIRIKATTRRQDSLSNGASTPGSGAPADRTRRMSQPLSRVVTESVEIRAMVAGKRRQSSIAYYTPSSPSPWSQRPQSNRTPSSSGDSPRDMDLVAVNGRETHASKRSSLVLSSRSPSTRESVSSLDVTAIREREPFTLVEKHADLLHFIAQKERKCLELRDQLAVHEKELAELKHKWEHIVHRGHEPFPNSPLSSGIGGAALDGLKEGVRMIAAGFTDFSGVIHELESAGDDSRTRPVTHTPHQSSNTLNGRGKRKSKEQLSTSSLSSSQEDVHSSDVIPNDGEGEAMVIGMTVATASSPSRSSSLNSRIHKRASRVISKEPMTVTTVSASTPSQSFQSPDLDEGMSLKLAPGPTFVPPLLDVVSASATPTPKSPVIGPTNGPVSLAAGPISSWMDSMGKKLSELQKGQTFSKSQKRASLLLAGVSSTISSALSLGPTATTPAPLPGLSSRTSSGLTYSSSLIRQRHLSEPQLQPSFESESRAYPSYRSMADWLDDDDEQTAHAGKVLVPDSRGRPCEVVVGTTTTAVSSFDDDWNW